MKTIKIFLASSEELKTERGEMTELVYQLNRLFKGRGIELELERWEYLDASMSNQRKQDEYNDVLRQCDICMVLFWRKFGCFTGEELDTAYQQMQEGGKPQKIYVFFKNSSDNEISGELKDFIQDYEHRYGGHFFCKFQNVDALKLEFLLQFELYQKDQLGTNAIEVRQEHVYIGNEAVADLNNIPFAANNKGFQDKQAELKELREEIAQMQAELEKKQQKLERKKQKLEQDPEDEDNQEDYQDAKEAVDSLTGKLQKKLDRKNKLEEEFEQEQQNLFQTARRIAEVRGRKISDRMARAIEAFESGDASRADTILDEAEKDADEALADVQAAKRMGLQSLEELLLKVSVKMSNETIPIEERIAATKKIYEKADALARECDYDKKKQRNLLSDYDDFLEKYGFYDEELNVCQRLLRLSEELYGMEHHKTASAYSDIGVAYFNKNDYVKALEYFLKDLSICEKLLGKEHPDTAKSYNNIGSAHYMLGDYNKALEFFFKDLAICEKVLGKEHPDMATAYNNIGAVYNDQNNYKMALEYYFKAITICEITLGKDHPNTAAFYNNIGLVYDNMGDYPKALEFYFKALAVREKMLGKEHPDTATSYDNIGGVYRAQGNYSKALEYRIKALAITKKQLGKLNIDTARSYNNIGAVYRDMAQYDKALEYISEAFAIAKQIEDLKHIAIYHNRLGRIYALMGDKDAAREHFQQAIDLLPEDHPESKDSKERIEYLK